MAALQPDEIRPGLVAFLDPEVLARDERVVNTKDPRTGIRPGPFVCVSEEDETSQARLDEEWTESEPPSDSPLNEAEEDDGRNLSVRKPAVADGRGFEDRLIGRLREHA